MLAELINVLSLSLWPFVKFIPSWESRPAKTRHQCTVQHKHSQDLYGILHYVIFYLSNDNGVAIIVPPFQATLVI